MSDLNTAQFAFKNAVNLYNDNNLNDAIEQLNEILKIHPNHENALDLSGIIFIKQNKLEEALNVVNKSIQLVKNNKKFEINAVELLYSLPLNSYTLINDENNNIYLAKVKKIFDEKTDVNKNIDEYTSKQNTNNKNSNYHYYHYYHYHYHHYY